ncbi:MAG: Stp1/IreP family PP2C-type Ser/Thr phosphatase [Gammaproteobacteria bacterium]|nr:Stp1/IreP family PP2C-type Ser/Thr phosphatase [Gammaproteobacteria bacterium]MBT5907390.1 Stp1/IreP family PP2C-type Ser/Thr phosphatase [Gammaproteobacteria bacterium]MBT7764016.1 Stp1/IreP family PP2C-type Ser/Thr phosphatase [Gammaproteobacteria bacterium]MDG1795657.1 Stp1/IreP family PP2C-type Ser/Thr phosphatase [Gammaproteobacteria bacterium]
MRSKGNNSVARNDAAVSEMSDDLAATCGHFCLAAESDTGRKRKTNQDRFYIDAESSLIVIADGMGGHRAGELAAQIAVERIPTHFAAAQSDSDHSAAECLHVALAEANAAIFAQAAAPENAGMGTTAIAAHLLDDQLNIAHIGDSRLYLFRRGSLEQLTHDHSLLQDLIDDGFYTERTSRSTGVGHVVTRALGIKAAIDSDKISCTMQEGDLLLFCTDGLSDLVADWQISDTLADCKGDLAFTCRTLINHANRNGGRDNVTVVLASYRSARDK